MKYVVKIFTFSFLLLSSCSSMIQVVETKSYDLKFESDTYFYEDEHVIVSYDLWEEDGKMLFSIYNKSDKPLYIDWSKSSFIKDGISKKYWSDLTVSKSEFESKTRLYRGNYGFGLGSTKGEINTTILKEEKISFIEPRASLTREYSPFINPSQYFGMKGDVARKEVALNSKLKKTTEVEIVKYDLQNSPMKIRNFLSFAYSSDFSDEFFIDTELYISKVQKMQKNHFQYYENNSSGFELVSPFIESNSFYLEMQK